VSSHFDVVLNFGVNRSKSFNSSGRFTPTMTVNSKLAAKPKPKPKIRATPGACTAHKAVGCELCGSAVLAALIEAGESVKVVGELVQVPFRNICFSAGHQRQGRGLHLNSVVERSIRTNGWDYNSGSTLRLIEKKWTDEAWTAEITAGRVPSGTERPVLLRLTKWAVGTNGTARICAPDMVHRRFILDDGHHRTAAMRLLQQEKHVHAIEICERGCVLLDCDAEEDKDKMIFSSIAANNKHLAIDKDFLADKIGQIKQVRVFCFGLDSPSKHSSPPHHKHELLDTQALHGRRRRSQ